MNQSFASHLIPIFELIAGITGIYCYAKNRNTFWFWFAIFLLCLFGLEELAGWFGKHKMYDYNVRLAKWVTLPFWLGVTHIMFYITATEKIKRFAIINFVNFVVITLYEILIIGKEHYFTNSLSLSYSCLAVLFFCMLYFFGLVKSKELLHFKTQMAFWFYLGLFVFFLGCFPYLTFFNSLAISKNRDAASMYRWIFIFLNYIMYLLFTIGFICSKPKRLLL